MNNMLVSVVVPAFNCEKTISKTIQSILSQKYKPLEAIVVDDGSTDDTAQEIKSFKEVKYIYQDNQGPASARNKGALEAEGKIIFFTDSDCIAHNDWIENALEYFRDPSVSVVAGSYGIANKDFILSRCIHKEIIYRHNSLMPENSRSFGSYNFGIRKEIFENVHGFNISYRFASGEDNDLSYKILKAGGKIKFSKKSIVEHFHTTKIIKYLREQFRHGFWRFKIYYDHPQMAAGDDYTFWKDIVEIMLALIIMISISGIFVLPLLCGKILFCSFCFLFLLEIFYGFIITKNFLEGLFFSFVMFLRSFYRTAGFIAGLIYFLKTIKK